MGNENAERIQTSLLNAAEKRLLVWMANRMPAWVTSDMLTYIGVAGAVIYAAFCWMAQCNVNYFWMAALGLAINWFGDSLDGSLARVRDTQRPKYGFFIDHSLDALTTCLICMGLGLSPLMDLSISLFIMGGYLCLSIYTYLSTIVINRFQLTYASLGPTEMRLIIIAVFMLYMYTPLKEINMELGSHTFTIYDCLGAVIAAGLYLAYIISMTKDLKALAKIDPLKPSQKK
jgi:phosphatidylglycerophosphate synthase